MMEKNNTDTSCCNLSFYLSDFVKTLSGIMFEGNNQILF